MGGGSKFKPPCYSRLRGKPGMEERVPIAVPDILPSTKLPATSEKRHLELSPNP